jgi:hypothetical protein
MEQPMCALSLTLYVSVLRYRGVEPLRCLLQPQTHTIDDGRYSMILEHMSVLGRHVAAKVQPPTRVLIEQYLMQVLASRIPRIPRFRGTAQQRGLVAVDTAIAIVDARCSRWRLQVCLPLASRRVVIMGVVVGWLGI